MINITLVVGWVGAFGITLYGMMIGGPISWFLDPTSVLITIGGSLMTVVAQTPLSDLKNVGIWMKIAFFPPKYDPKKYIDQIVEYATLARSKGLLALEESANQQKDPFFKQALMLIVDATEPEKVRAMLESAVDATAERHQAAPSFFKSGASMGPAFGMIGTLVGLVQMLKSMGGDMSGLGDAMGTAIITTFYGSMEANVIFVPLEAAMKNAHANEEFCMNIIIEGVLAIAEGGNPRFIRDKLEMMLSDGDKAGDTGAAAE